MINILPSEIIIGNILPLCDDKTISKFGQTKKHFLTLSSNVLLWKKRFANKWPFTYQLIQSTMKEWKEAYKSQTLHLKRCSKEPNLEKFELNSYTKTFFSPHGDQLPLSYDHGLRIQYRRNDPASLPNARLTVLRTTFDSENSSISLEKFPQVPHSELSRIRTQANQIAIGMTNGALYFFNGKGKFIRHFKEHTKAITDLCIHDNLVITASEDGLIKTWKGDQPRSIDTLKDHQAAVTSLASLSQSFISGSKDKTVKIWSLTPEIKVQATIPQSAEISCVQSLNSHLFAAANVDGVISIYDAKKLNCVQTLQIEGTPEQKNVKAMYWDARVLVTLSANKTLQIWDYNKGKCLSTHQLKGDSTDPFDPSGLYGKEDQLFVGHRSHILYPITWNPNTLQICIAKIKDVGSQVKKFVQKKNLFPL